MSATRNKPKHHQAVRTTVSLQPKVYDAVLEMIRLHGFAGISGYIDYCARRDSGLNDSIDSPILAEK